MQAQDEDLWAKRFRERLKQAREERCNWTQAELAEHAHVSTVTVSKLEQGKNLPTFEVLVAICSALKISPNDLLGWNSPPLNDEDMLLSERVISGLRRVPKAQGEAVMVLLEALAKN